LTKNAKNLCREEVQLFGKLVLSGEFYEYFFPEFYALKLEYLEQLCLSLLKKEFTSEYSQFRRIVKSAILGMFFAKTSEFKSIQSIFMKKFPSIHQWINKTKVCGSGKDRYKQLSNALFQFEAYYMLQKIAKSFNKRHRGQIPLFTIHDCLVTTVNHLDELHRFMKSEFEDAFGVSPQLKKEIWQLELDSNDSESGLQIAA